MIYIFGAIKLTGPFVTMIISMITSDMFTFSIIYVIFLLGFTQARLIILVQSRPIIFLLSGFLLPHEEYERRTVRWVPHNLDCSLPHDSGRIWGRLFMFGDSGVNNFWQIFQYDELNESPYPAMVKVVFVLFQILIPILLLNMLIAMMGNTYAIVIEKSEKEFLKQVIFCRLGIDNTKKMIIYCRIDTYKGRQRKGKISKIFKHAVSHYCCLILNSA